MTPKQQFETGLQRVLQALIFAAGASMHDSPAAKYVFGALIALGAYHFTIGRKNARRNA